MPALALPKMVRSVGLFRDGVALAAPRQAPAAFGTPMPANALFTLTAAPPPALPSTPLSAPSSIVAAAELQDHLLAAHNDLERLQRLLDDAARALMQHFTFAAAHMDAALACTDAARAPVPAAAAGEPQAMREARRTLAGAVTALQFQDMATQLIAHTSRRLRACADRLARDVMADDEDGAALVEEEPLRPNPVTQDEMDAGSIELF
jgi:hypothetical protein